VTALHVNWQLRDRWQRPLTDVMSRDDPTCAANAVLTYDRHGANETNPRCGVTATNTGVGTVNRFSILVCQHQPKLLVKNVGLLQEAKWLIRLRAGAGIPLDFAKHATLQAVRSAQGMTRQPGCLLRLRQADSQRILPICNEGRDRSEWLGSKKSALLSHIRPPTNSRSLSLETRPGCCHANSEGEERFQEKTSWRECLSIQVRNDDNM
jgi:hypothetical protein